MTLPINKLGQSLRPIYYDQSKMWDKIFGNFDAFQSMVINLILQKNRASEDSNSYTPSSSTDDTVLTDELRIQVFERDNYTCKCCGKKTKRGRSLTVDHIRPISMGGKSVLSNLQTLCSECNTMKDRQEIDFKITSSPLTEPKPLNLSIRPSQTEDPKNILKRIINDMYHCCAVCNIKYHKRKSGEFYYKWLIKLYDGNNPAWLENHKDEILDYIHNVLHEEHVTDIIIK